MEIIFLIILFLFVAYLLFVTIEMKRGERFFNQTRTHLDNSIVYSVSYIEQKAGLILADYMEVWGELKESFLTPFLNKFKKYNSKVVSLREGEFELKEYKKSKVSPYLKKFDKIKKLEN